MGSALELLTGRGRDWERSEAKRAWARAVEESGISAKEKKEKKEKGRKRE